MPMRPQFSSIFKKFVNSKYVKDTYAENMYKSLQLIENFEDPHKVYFHFPVDKRYCNLNGMMHGGAMATLIDITSTLAIFYCEKEELRRHVSINLDVTFHNAAELGKTLLVEAECQKLGKSLAFTRANVFDEEKIKILSSGVHNKAIIPGAFSLE